MKMTIKSFPMSILHCSIVWHA